jgi:hypothetical protein
VKHRANPKFWQFYEQLPREIQALADKNFALLKRNPQHPSLHFKKSRTVLVGARRHSSSRGRSSRRRGFGLVLDRAA